MPILLNSMTLTSFVFTELANTIKYGGGVLYKLVFTEWRHCISQNDVWGRGCYVTLFSPSDVTAFHRIRYCMSQNEVWGRGCYVTLFSPSDVTAFHRIRCCFQIDSTIVSGCDDSTYISLDEYAWKKLRCANIAWILSQIT